MKLLLINPPIREFAKPNNPPLGLLYLASYLEQHGHSVDVADLNAHRQLSSDWRGYLDTFFETSGLYDIVGVSGLISTYAWQRLIIDYLKEYSRKYFLLVLGGGMATFATEFVQRNYPEISIIVLDEGEETLRCIVEDGHSKHLEKVDGISFRVSKITGALSRVEDVWVTNPKSSLIENLDSLPFPDFTKVPTEEVYLENPIWGRATGNSSGINYDMKRSLSMIMSRGCPFRCKFCAHAFKVKGHEYRLRSPDNVLAEIDELVDRYNIDFIGFLDDNTTYNRDWMVEFCLKLIERPYKLHWGGSARVDEVDEQLLKLMRHADCEWLGFGLESVSPTVLKNMNKGHRKYYLQQAKEAIRLTKESGIWCNCTFIAGYPGESWDSIKDTAKFMKDWDVCNNMFFATAYPSTALYEEQKHRIWQAYGDEDSYIKSLGDATEFRINYTDNLSDDELQYARKCAIAGRPELISKEVFGKEIDVKADLDPLNNPNLLEATAV